MDSVTSACARNVTICVNREVEIMAVHDTYADVTETLLPRSSSSPGSVGGETRASGAVVCETLAVAVVQHERAIHREEPKSLAASAIRRGSNNCPHSCQRRNSAPRP